MTVAPYDYNATKNLLLPSDITAIIAECIKR